MLKLLFLVSFIEKIAIARTSLMTPTKNKKAAVPLLEQDSSTMSVLTTLASIELHLKCKPSRNKTFSRHLRIVLELSSLDKPFLRYLQDFLMQMTCNRHFQDILLLSLRCAVFPLKRMRQWYHLTSLRCTQTFP